MLYLVAFFCPPVALVVCGKPLSAILNLLWIFAGFLTIGVFAILGVLFIPVFGIGAIVHAILVVSQHLADERQRELIGALGGKVKPKSNWEMAVAGALIIAAGAVVFVLLATGVIAWRFDPSARRFVKIAPATTRTSPQPAEAAAVPAETKNVPQVVEASPPPAAAPQSSEPEAAKPKEMQPLPPQVEGWNYSEMVATFGEPDAKDKATGIATWRKANPPFKARFEKGVVTETSAAD